VSCDHAEPGRGVALRHQHLRGDEFVYILQGEATLVTNEGETLLLPGMCAGFAAGNGDAHMPINRSGLSRLLEIRPHPVTATYPDDDLVAFSTQQGVAIHAQGRPALLTRVRFFDEIGRRAPNQ
jgi:uncharacterized cupin superfamily protein